LIDRLGTVNEKHLVFKQVFRSSKPHTFSIFSGEKEYSLLTKQQEVKQEGLKGPWSLT